MRDLTPTLADIRIRYEFLKDYRVMLLSDHALRSLMTMVGFIAASMVWTYTPPGTGAIPDDDKRLVRLAMSSPRQWRKIRPELEQFFLIQDGEWLLTEPWIEIVGAAGYRVAIPAKIKDQVRQREGERCTYCGATDRPLEFDHIYPVSRGGTNDPSNLTLACYQCNRSKGASTLEEWMRG